MEFNFPKKEGSGIAKLIPQVSADIVDCIQKMLTYNYDNRMSAGQALKHPAFQELRDADKS
jgi:renal tumor antigen